MKETITQGGSLYNAPPLLVLAEQKPSGAANDIETQLEDAELLRDTKSYPSALSQDAVELAKKRYILAFRQKVIAKEIYKEIEEATQHLVDAAGMEYSWKDEPTGVVFIVGKPCEFTQVKNKTIEVRNTRSEEFGDKKGTLSLKDAKELGYVVK